MATGLVVGLATLDTGLVGLATLEWPVGLATLGPREGGQVRSSESCRPHGSALPAPPVIWRHSFLTASDPTKCRPLHHHQGNLKLINDFLHSILQITLLLQCLAQAPSGCPLQLNAPVCLRPIVTVSSTVTNSVEQVVSNVLALLRFKNFIATFL
jgi:hypothetical protein